MANQKISQLTESTTPGDNDLIPMVVDGVTVKVKKSALLAAVTNALEGKVDKSGPVGIGAHESVKFHIITDIYSNSALGFPTVALGWNISRDATTGTWTTGTDSVNNGAQIIIGSIHGTDLKQVIIPSTNPTKTPGDPSVPVAAQTFTDAQIAAMFAPLGGDKADKDLTINTQTASYTLALSDRGGMVRMNVASANTLTVPPNSAVAFPVGTQLIITQAGAGQTTIVAGSGVTINASGAKMKLTGQWSGATLIQVSANVWTLLGDLSA